MLDNDESARGEWDRASETFDRALAAAVGDVDEADAELQIALRALIDAGNRLLVAAYAAAQAEDERA